ncbi:MAG: hypothetical protein R2774_01315 [Saprospiraceae bacterium]
MKIFSTIIFLLLHTCVHSQILGGIMNEAKRKLERKIEDKIIHTISDELARRAFKPIESSIDSIMRQKYQDSISGGQPVDWEKAGAAYADFLKGMNATLELPEKYTFDVTQEVEIIDYNNKKNLVKMHYSKNEPVLAMENLDDEDTKSIVVMDMTKDAMILYTTDKKGNKQGQIIPSVSKLTKTVVSAAEKENENYEITKTGKSKKIAGYQSNEYKGKTKEENITMYISTDFPINAQKSMQAYMSKLAPQSYNENMTNMVDSGFMMEFENVRLDEKGEKTTWITKKVSQKAFDIINAEYGLKNEK